MPTTATDPETLKTVATLALALAQQAPVELSYVFEHEQGETRDTVLVISMHPLHAVVMSLNAPDHLDGLSDVYYLAIPDCTPVTT